MADSTFEQPLPARLDGRAARAHDWQGKRKDAKWHVYPEQAAAGLWTTPTDLARVVIEIQRALHGSPTRGLAQATAREMITPVGIGPGGETLHLSPEGAAAEVAVALGAPKLILLQDAKGLVSGGEVRNQLTVDDLQHQLADGAVPLQTRPLVHAILRALAGGVERVHVLDGRLAHATIAELFTDDGVGTLVTAG